MKVGANAQLGRVVLEGRIVGGKRLVRVQVGAILRAQSDSADRAQCLGVENGEAQSGPSKARKPSQRPPRRFAGVSHRESEPRPEVQPKRSRLAEGSAATRPSSEGFPAWRGERSRAGCSPRWRGASQSRTVPTWRGDARSSPPSTRRRTAWPQRDWKEGASPGVSALWRSSESVRQMPRGTAFLFFSREI